MTTRLIFLSDYRWVLLHIVVARVFLWHHVLLVCKKM